MKNDSNELLNDLLADWHRWARFQIVASHGTTSAMFAGVRSSRQWDSENDVIDGTIRDQTMRAFDFHVNELDHLYRTALQIQARNLASGVHVWRSEKDYQKTGKSAISCLDWRGCAAG